MRITRRDFVAGSVVLGASATARGAAALPVTGLDHLNIHVPDVRRSAEFYIKLFGAEVARAPHAGANPGSTPAELWFIRLGQSFLAISPTPLGDKPGIDHFAFAVEGFNGEAMKQRLAGLNRQFSDAPAGNNLWAKDPGGYLIQMNAPATPSRVPGAGVGAILVEPVGGSKRNPAFQATRISHLTLAVSKLDASASYYRKLLGEGAGKQKGRFRVGASELVLGAAAGGESFRVSVAGFEAAAAVSKLKSLGVNAQLARDKSVAFRDPDGIRVQIG
jgi:catechol 2,3-dioxygenase-like lactoylglutathione lyase family enzyme